MFYYFISVSMERDTRFELALLVWRTNVLPLTLIPHLKETLGTSFYKFNTFYKIYLTLLCVPTNIKNYQYLFYPCLKGLARMVGFEPTNQGVKVPCLTAWLHPYIKPHVSETFYIKLNALKIKSKI